MTPRRAEAAGSTRGTRGAASDAASLGGRGFEDAIVALEPGEVRASTGTLQPRGSGSPTARRELGALRAARRRGRVQPRWLAAHSRVEGMSGLLGLHTAEGDREHGCRGER